MVRTPPLRRQSARLAPRLLITSLIAVGCGSSHGSDEPPDTAELPGVWEAKVEKPFEANDPEQLAFQVESSGGTQVARVCRLERADAVFEGPIESFRCEQQAVPVREAGAALEIDWVDQGVRLRIESRMGKDVLSGAALVQDWRELGETPFTAMRVPPSELP